MKRSWVLTHKNKFISFGIKLSSFVLWTLEIDFLHWQILIRLQKLNDAYKPNCSNEED